MARTARRRSSGTSTAGRTRRPAALRDAAFEVIYGRSPSAGADELAEAALQEDADAVVLDLDSVVALAGALVSRGIEDVLVGAAIDGVRGADVVARIERGIRESMGTPD